VQVSQLIVRTWGLADTKLIEKFERSRNIGVSGAFAEVRFGAQDGEFFRAGNVDELIEASILRLGNTAQFFQERWLQTKGKITLSHGSNFAIDKASGGRIIRIPNLGAACLKCATFKVTIRSARPLTAGSKTISSAGSVSSGRRKKLGVTGTPTAARIASILAHVAPAVLWCSGRFSTASYSSISGTESKSSKRFLRAKSKSCLEAPALLRNTATTTFVSKTTRTSALKHILQAILQAI
jgi:hypothetical protein